MQITKLRFQRTTLIMLVCLGILLGIGASALGIDIDASWIGLFLVLTLATYRRKSVLTAAVILILGLFIGAARGSDFLIKVDDYKDLYGKKVVVVGHVQSDGVYNTRSQLGFDLGSLKLVEPTEKELVGRISVDGFGESAVYRGDIVQVEGKLYPTRGSKQARISFAQMDVLQRGDSKIQKARQNFVAGMYSALPEPEASFGLGLLIGQRSTLPPEVTKILKVVGLTHIIAVSGYNLTILVRASQRLFGRRSKYQAVLASSVLITTFLIITGLSASIVRAAIVSGLALVAWYFGRQFRPTLLLLFTACITALWYPIYVWTDIGWYLSFLAFYGVLVVSPLLVRRIWKVKETGSLRQIVVESICAQIMTAPLIIFIFGQTSLIGLLANVAVVPLVPFAMLFSAIAGVAGAVVPQLAGWFAWPANIILTYMLDIAQILSKVPHALVYAKAGIVELIIMYAILFAVVGVIYRKTRADILLKERKAEKT
jgi:competence protein ComEC